ncbi:transcription termination factor MTEF18, mitochondrial-like [Phalaenopsis equestris]|uniref:transcription termination factor MTEF18, mitochondrial-like n=1 Tax=Phalaenopsis equestris TaxID=78828 RepID=UPI0009E4608C|nr:transcription termination factor MTEF18, mitochondrial-like [Phalaenopsis equestris]
MMRQVAEFFDAFIAFKSIMLRRWFLQRNSFLNMLIQTSNTFTLPAVSRCVVVVGKNPRDSSWKNSVFDARKMGAVDAVFSGRSYSSFRIQNYLRNLWNLQRKRSCCCISTMAAKSAPDGNYGSRMSRTERTDAQTALFDYLHYTRCLNFTDAEHISKNSPVFLQSLLAKVINGEEVGRSVSRFLRYTPINEFEPFFESLGLKPSELYPLLPLNLIYLTDDDLLIENYRVLCNYGVPRSKIGKMYKEGSEMFKYDHGVLNSKLRSYERLGLSKPTIIKLVNCCPALLIGDLDMDFLQVLKKLKALGVELDLIRGCLSDNSVYHWDRILKLLNFLDGMCCNQKDLQTLINQHPRFVFDDSGKKIYILVALLLKLGIKMSDIILLFVQYPRILDGKFVKNLWQAIYFLVDIGMNVEDIKMIVNTHPHVLGASSCKSTYSVLQRLKLSQDRLCNIIKEDPNQFTYLVTSKKSSAISLPKVEGSFLREKTDFLLRLGFVENSDEMARVLKKFRGRGDQLQERFDFLVEIGLDCHTATEMIKLVPPVLNQSIDVLDKKSAYLLNDLGYPLEALAAFPTYLCYNLDKIKLRFSMFQWLKENGISFSTKNRKLVSSTVALSTVLACSDARFFKYFVNLHPKGPEEWERLKGSFSSK